MRSCKKYLFISVCFINCILFVQCERELNEPEVNDDIKLLITTNHFSFAPNESITVRIFNYSNDTVFHFKCDNVDIVPFRIAVLQNNQWKFEGYYVICTTMGPTGFFAELRPSELIIDTVTLESPGNYKLQYAFIHNNDTLIAESNEFVIEQDKL